MQAWVAGDVEARAPGSESAVEIAARVRAVLDDIADQHRGEAVLVVTHGGAIVATQAVLDFRPGRTWDFAELRVRRAGGRLRRLASLRLGNPYARW